jgi:predicted pyridoxine 5'-phosphate oxidase superfamily flavin-nucleotide-binding protein
MKEIPEEVVHFFQNQGFVIVSTISKDGSLHNACKGIVEMSRDGLVYLLDLYRGKTHQNLKHNSRISVTAVDEHRFRGYCLKGNAIMMQSKELKPQLIKDWEDRITSRITQRLLRNIRQEKGHLRHPEALLPSPKYLIAMKVEEVIDLTPHHLK